MHNIKSEMVKNISKIAYKLIGIKKYRQSVIMANRYMSVVAHNYRKTKYNFTFEKARKDYSIFNKSEIKNEMDHIIIYVNKNMPKARQEKRLNEISILLAQQKRAQQCKNAIEHASGYWYVYDHYYNRPLDCVDLISMLHEMMMLGEVVA